MGKVAALALVLAVGFAGSKALAVIPLTSVAPGTTSTPAIGETAPIGGTVVAGGTPITFSSLNFPSIGFEGTLTSSVISGDTSNPWVGSGGLTFTYLLTSDADSISDMERATVNGFASFQTDVSFNIPTTGVAPASVSRSSGTGTTVGFSFSTTSIGPGQESALLVIQTDATAWQASNMQIIDGDVAVVSSFSPVPTAGGPGTPEPATLSVAGIGAMTLLLRRRRRHA